MSENDGLYFGVKALRNKLYEDIKISLGLEMRMTEGLRSIQDQAMRYAQGRTMPGPIVTRAKPGYSFHNYGLAFDSCFKGKDPYLETLRTHDPKHYEYCWKKFGDLAKSHGLFWGGDFKTLPDRPHCEKRYGLSIIELHDMYDRVGISGIHEYIKTIEGGT